MSDRSDYEHCCPNSGPSFDCGVVQALRERIAELEATICRISGGESMGRIALLEAVAEAAVVIYEQGPLGNLSEWEVLGDELKAAGYLGGGG